MIMSERPHPQYPGVVWGKSSHSSDPDLAVCVELADVGGGRHAVRDSTDPAGPVLDLAPGALRGLLRSIKAQP